MKILSSIRKHAIVFTTLFVIIALGLIYLFGYIPHNEKVIRAQRFKVLQEVDKTVHTKIENSVALLDNLLTAYEPRTGKEEPVKFDSSVLENYIKYLSGKNFSIIPRHIIRDSLRLSRDSLDKVYTLTINNKTQEITLTYSRQYETHHTINVHSRQNHVHDTIQVHEIGMRFSFNQFISPLLPQNVFDDYLIFSDGRTVYETFPAGISYVKADSLMGLNKGMSRSSLHDFNISGKDYKVFLQPVHFTSETEWVIAGLLSARRYEVEKKQLPPQVVLLLITLGFCVIVLAPWIKLFHMGGKDRLTVVDGAFSVLVSMLLVSILFLCFFKYNLPFRTDDSPDSKSVLANNIADAFKKEIDSVYIKLNEYNNGLKEHMDSLGKDIIYIEKIKTFFSLDSLGKRDHPVHQTLLDKLSHDTSINHFYWLNRNGDEIFRWSRDSLIPPHGNFIARNYFTNVIQGKTYSLRSPYDRTIHSFYLDQVISWTSGNFTSVLSIPYSDGHDTVAAASFKMRSLTNAILPAGYQFALIDNDGKVLYHSQPSHNLNENLLDKFSAADELQSSLNSHTEATFRTNYLSRHYNVKVKPLTEIPYFIVILSDTAFKETRDLEIYSFTFTLLVLFIAFLLLEMLVLFFASAKRSFLKKHLFDTTWIGPKISMHYEYLFAAAFNFITIIALLCLFAFPSFLTYGFILLFSISYLTLFLNQLYYKKYKESASFKAGYKSRAKVIMIGWITIIDIAAFKLLETSNFAFLLIYEIFIIEISTLIHNNSTKIRSKIEAEGNTPAKENSQSEKNLHWAVSFVNSSKRYLIDKFFWGRGNNYTKSFTLMLVTRLIITSGIPVVFFYVASYNYEQNVIIRYKHSEFGDKLVEKLPTDRGEAVRFIRERPAVYIDSSWVRTMDAVNDSGHYKNYSSEDSTALSVLNGFRPDLTGEAIREERFNMISAADSTFFYNSLLKNAFVKDTGTVMYRTTNIPGLQLKLTSTALNYSSPLVFHSKGWLFWLFLTMALVLFFFLLQEIIKKLFALKIPDVAAWDYLDENILRDNKINERIFVIGAPGTKKRRQIVGAIDNNTIKTKDGEKLVYLKENAASYFIADMIKIPDSKEDVEGIKNWDECKATAVGKDIKLVIVSHFEYNIESAYANMHKLSFLESLMLAGIEKIMILSTVHPLAFLDSIFFEEKHKKEKGESSEQSPIPKSDLERWNVLLGHYTIVLMPLGSYKEQGIGADTVQKLDKFSLEGAIDEEIKKVHFLDKLKTVSLATANMVKQKAKEDEKDFNPEELAFKLQMTSHYFYMYIWQSLTKEEKFLLYDLAEDNLVNSFDDHNLALLIGKGIIYREDGTLKLFNKGFRNFILTAIGNSEAMKIKERIKDNGNWSKWRTPLILIFVAILLFLMVSQEEVYNDLLFYVGALGTGIPIFLKLLSFFDSGGRKQV
jgi:hypothetical protein